jgi:hypothetical protein
MWARIYLVILLFLGMLLPSYASSYYAYDGSSLRSIDENEAKRLDVKEWQIWLFKRGISPGSRSLSPWGSIVSKSPEGATAKLKAGQAFEISYCHFMGKPSDCESNMTYFAPMGPIAMIGRPQTIPQKLLSTLDDITTAQEKLNQLIGLKEAMDRTYSIDVGEVKGTNPYAGIGNALKEYGQQLGDRIIRIKKFADDLAQDTLLHETWLEQDIDRLTGPSPGDHPISASLLGLEQKAHELNQSLPRNNPETQATHNNPAPKASDPGDVAEFEGDWTAIGASITGLRISGSSISMSEEIRNPFGGSLVCSLSGDRDLQAERDANSTSTMTQYIFNMTPRCVGDGDHPDSAGASLYFGKHGRPALVVDFFQGDDKMPDISKSFFR